jgi:hypothetical protein
MPLAFALLSRVRGKMRDPIFPPTISRRIATCKSRPDIACVKRRLFLENEYGGRWLVICKHHVNDLKPFAPTASKFMT